MCLYVLFRITGSVHGENVLLDKLIHIRGGATMSEVVLELAVVEAMREANLPPYVNEAHVAVVLMVGKRWASTVPFISFNAEYMPSASIRFLSRWLSQRSGSSEAICRRTPLWRWQCHRVVYQHLSGQRQEGMIRPVKATLQGSAVLATKVVNVGYVYIETVVVVAGKSWPERRGGFRM